LGQPADLLDRLADREVSGGVVATVAQRADALVEHRLRALFFLFQQLLGHEALGEKQARRHAGHREQVGLGVEEAGEIAALEKRALALVRAVVREKDLAILHGASYFPSNPTRSMVARSACSVCAAHCAYSLLDLYQETWSSCCSSFRCSGSSSVFLKASCSAFTPCAS